MGTDDGLSRREFLLLSGTVVEGGWIAAHLPAVRAAAALARRAAREGQTAFSVLSVPEARDLEAIAAQIFPSDETPGAKEAGIVHFLDRALGDFAAASLERIRAGLDDLRARGAARHGQNAVFADLLFDEQTALLREIEESEFFQAVRDLTVTGMFALPSYGGNRDEIGWRILGYDHSPVFAPPFGHYDREYVERGGGS